MKKWTILVLSISLVISIFLLGSGKELERPTEIITNQKSKPEKNIPYHLNLLNNEVDAFMASEYRKRSFPGVAVAIVYGDSLIYLNTFGKKKAESKNAINENSVFRIGSLSKGFNGILASILATKNLISLDEKVRNNILEMSLSNKKYESELALRHLLSHTGGFPYHSYTNLVEAGSTISNITKEFIQIENLSKPGTQYSYQNAAFSISESVLENQLRKPYSDLLQDYIFEPLGMKNSSCSLVDLTSNKNVAYPQYFKKGGWKTRKPNEKYYNTISAGGINVSIKDMSIWMKALLGYYPDVISEKSIEIAFNPFIETKAKHKYYQKWPNFHNSYYGLGWRIHTLENVEKADSLETIIHHGGQVNGYRSEIMLHPEKEFGICVLFSNYSLLAKNIIPNLIEILEASEIKPE